MMLEHFVVSNSDQQMPMRMWKLAFVFARAERHLVPLRCRLHADVLLSWASLFVATDVVDVEMLDEKALRRTQLMEKDRRETMVSLRLVCVCVARLPLLVKAPLCSATLQLDISVRV